MARRIKTPIEKLDQAISKVLDDYSDEIIEDLDDVAKKFAQKGAAALRAESSADFDGTGKYARGWTSYLEKHRLYTTAIIYNQTPGLPHLLEHGHLMRNGLRWTPPKQHISPIEERLVQQYETEVLSKL